MLRKLFNRRKHTRYIAAQDTYIIFQHKSEKEKILPIVEISEGGCRFTYNRDEYDPEKICFVTLMTGDAVFLDTIKISTISDKPASGPYIKRGVVFRPQNTLEIKRLKRFIEKVSLCKA